MIKTWIKRLWTTNNVEDRPQANSHKKESDVMESKNDYLINHDTIDQIVKDTSIEILPLLIENYLEEATLRSDNILKALDKQDFETLEFEAHTLGSTSLAMGATGLGLLARKIETACLNGTPTKALEHKMEFQQLAEQSKLAFSKILEQAKTE
ncbi:Hpt domain-containing protein [Vibrio alfacsensis]|uniref:Hpt domain-containing protein n=1 Tax=Vibrio alfacsensis TaxID=1074311 RepID=UPI001C7F919F|nr:Hpt domain-containing protein [Vibrio alfacsensis]